MKLEDLKNGQLYRIVREAKNPNRDLRASRDWRLQDLSPDGELLCTLTHSFKDTAKSIELQPYANLPGADTPSVHTLLCGWLSDGKIVPVNKEARYAPFVSVVLDCIEPFEPRDFDDELASFNAANWPHSLSWRDIAHNALATAYSPQSLFAQLLAEKKAAGR